MDPAMTLVFAAGLAWGGQIILGWLQIQRFNRALLALADSGRVGIGRSSGYFTPRVVVVLSINGEGRITDNFVMKGLTVFSRPVEDRRLTGLFIDDIYPDRLFPGNKAARQALGLAISNKR